MELFSFDVPITKTRFCVYVLLAVLFAVFLILNSSDAADSLLYFGTRVERVVLNPNTVGGMINFIIPLTSFVVVTAVTIYYVFRGLIWFILSPGFCVFYLIKCPVEAVFLYPYLLGLALLSRKHHIDQKIWFFLSLIPYIFGLYNGNDILLKILVLPLFHLISKNPEVVSGSRFVSGEVLVKPIKSTSEKSRMAEFKFADWWQYLEPYVKHLPSIIFYKGEVISDNKSIKESFMTSDIKGIKINYDLVESNVRLLIERDKEFNAPDFVKKARKMFYLIQSAVSNQNLQRIEHMVSDALYEQLSVKIAEQKNKGIYYRDEELSIEKIEISNVNFDQNYDEITVLIAYKTKDAVYDIKTKALLDEAPAPKKVMEYWVLIRKPSAVSAKGGGLSDSVCPNCGAEVKIGQATVCGACRSYLRSGAYDWVLTKMAQSYEWVHSNPDFIEGWNDVKELDPNFNIYNIEDICGVLFWQLRLAEKHNNSEYISRFAFPEYKEKIQTILATTGVTQKTNWEGIALGGIYLQAIKIEADKINLYVQLVWSAIPYFIDNRGKILPGSRINKCMREIYLISRPIGEKTNLDNTLSSLHCPKCGGQLARGIVGDCAYCGFDLSDAKSWRLERGIASGEEEYRKITEKQANKIVKEFSQYYVRNENIHKEKAKIETMVTGREIVCGMAKMLYADGVADEAELEFLRKTAERYMLPEFALNEIIEAAKDGTLETPISDHKPLAIAIFQGMAEMAYADGVFTPEEEAVLQDMAEKLEYDKYTFKMFMKKAELKSKKAQKQV